MGIWLFKFVLHHPRRDLDADVRRGPLISPVTLWYVVQNRDFRYGHGVGLRCSRKLRLASYR